MFIATVSAVQELQDVETFLVALAESPDGEGACLEIQRAFEFDDQDEQLGMDTYCLCTETGATYYGGVLSWRVEAGLLSISLDESAAAELGIDQNFSIALRLTDSEIDALVEGIERALGFPKSE